MLDALEAVEDRQLLARSRSPVQGLTHPECSLGPYRRVRMGVMGVVSTVSSIIRYIMVENQSSALKTMFMAPLYDPTRPFGRYTRESETSHHQHNRHCSATPCPPATDLTFPTCPHVTYLELRQHLGGAERL